MMSLDLVFHLSRMNLPDQIVGVVRCQNPNCISNTPEPIKSSMLVNEDSTILVKLPFFQIAITVKLTYFCPNFV
jgi:aspartate carbamoyltransferase regulatory subunit